MQCNNLIRHRVTYGDTLYELAKQYGVPLSDILRDNPTVNPRRMHIGDIIHICLDRRLHPSITEPAFPPRPEEDMALCGNMRRAWQDHAVWTRMTMNSLLGNQPDLPYNEARLLRTAEAIAAVFEPYFGAENAAAIQKLITEHIQAVGQWMQDVKMGNTAHIPVSEQAMRDNARAIVESMVRLSPNYTRAVLGDMLMRHLDLIEEQVMAILAGDFAKSIDAFERYEKEARDMADAFSMGLTGQLFC